jgi:hypothetical protein
MEDEKAQNDAKVNESKEAKTDEQSIPALDIPSIAVPKIEIVSDIDDSKLTADEPSIVSEVKMEEKVESKAEEKVEAVAEEKAEEKSEPEPEPEPESKPEPETEPKAEEKAEPTSEPKAEEKAEPEAAKVEEPQSEAKPEKVEESKPKEKVVKIVKFEPKVKMNVKMIPWDESKHKAEAGNNPIMEFLKSYKARVIGTIAAIVVAVVAVTGLLITNIGPLAKPAPMTIEQYVKSNKKAARDLADIATRNTNGFMTMRIVVKGDELQALYTFNKQANKDVLPTIKAAMRQAFNEPKAVKTFTTLPAGFPADKIRPSHVRVVLYNHDGKELLAKVYPTMK